MSKFRIKPKRKTEISTASLPDIVFLLLFFFMMTASIRPKDDKVQVTIPKAEALSEIEQQSLISELIMGPPKDPRLGTAPKISADGKFINTTDVSEWVLTRRNKMPEHLQSQMVILIRADESVKMGIISDVQEQLREVNARKVLYRTLKKN